MEDQLQAADLMIESAFPTEAKDRGCVITGDIAGNLPKYVIPVISSLFTKDMGISCCSLVRDIMAAGVFYAIKGMKQ